MADLDSIKNKIKKPMIVHSDKYKWAPVGEETFDVEESQFTIRLYYNQIVPEIDALKAHVGEANLDSVLSVMYCYSGNNESVRGSETMNVNLNGTKYVLAKGVHFKILS